MISQTAEYALRAIAHLAEHFDEPCTSQQIADHTHVPQDYMSKVLKGLVNSGLVSSQRGLYGGFRLVRTPEELAVIDVIESVSPLKRITECPMGKSHGANRLCPLHQLLDDAIGQIAQTFGQKTIGELLETNPSGLAICDNANHRASEEPPRKKKKSGRAKRSASRDKARKPRTDDQQ